MDELTILLRDAMLVQIPEDASNHMLGFCDAPTLLQCASVNTEWKQGVDRDQLWAALSHKMFKTGDSKADFSLLWQHKVGVSTLKLENVIEEVSELFFLMMYLVAAFTALAWTPAVVVLRLDGYLTWSWKHVFLGCNLLIATPLLFAFMRISLLFALTYNGRYKGQLSRQTMMKMTLFQGESIKGFVEMAQIFFIGNGLLIPLELYLEKIISSFFPVFAVWGAFAIIAGRSVINETPRAWISVSTNVSCFLISSFLLSCSLDGYFPEITYGQIFSPLLPILGGGYGRVYFYLYPIWLTPGKTIAEKVMLSMNIHDELEEPVNAYPLVAVILLFLKLNGSSTLSFTLISLDYWRWLAMGPLLSALFGVLYD